MEYTIPRASNFNELLSEKTMNQGIIGNNGEGKNHFHRSTDERRKNFLQRSRSG
jgi:hypothetical protein